MKGSGFHRKQPGGRQKGRHRRSKLARPKRKKTRRTSLSPVSSGSNPGYQGPSSSERRVAEKLGWGFDLKGDLILPGDLTPGEIIKAILKARESG